MGSSSHDDPCRTSTSVMYEHEDIPTSLQCKDILTSSPYMDVLMPHSYQDITIFLWFLMFESMCSLSYAFLYISYFSTLSICYVIFYLSSSIPCKHFTFGCHDAPPPYHERSVWWSILFLHIGLLYRFDTSSEVTMGSLLLHQLLLFIPNLNTSCRLLLRLQLRIFLIKIWCDVKKRFRHPILLWHLDMINVWVITCLDIILVLSIATNLLFERGQRLQL